MQPQAACFEIVRFSITQLAKKGGTIKPAPMEALKPLREKWPDVLVASLLPCGIHYAQQIDVSRSCGRLGRLLDYHSAPNRVMLAL